MSETLLPCPCCGSNDIDPAFGQDAERVPLARGDMPGCRSCGLLAPDAETWNRRLYRTPASLREEIDGLRQDTLALEARADRYLAAIRWALGENGEFRPPSFVKAPGPYWWRRELRRRALLRYSFADECSVDLDEAAEQALVRAQSAAGGST